MCRGAWRDCGPRVVVKASNRCRFMASVGDLNWVCMWQRVSNCWGPGIVMNAGNRCRFMHLLSNLMRMGWRESWIVGWLGVCSDGED